MSSRGAGRSSSPQVDQELSHRGGVRGVDEGEPRARDRDLAEDPQERLGPADGDHAQALDVALCWGWIDGIRKAFDERSFLQRYTPRRAQSIWSQINRDHVARLTAAGRMTPHGQRQVDAAKADGRWDAAYAPIRSASAATIPADLRAAIEANPRARKTFRTLGRMNLFALAFRTNNMKTPAGRARKIAALVAMLARGETIVPERR